MTQIEKQIVKMIEDKYGYPYMTYDKAEQYLLDAYTKFGIGSLVTRAGNVYYVEPYTMNF